ncbi:DUF6101 family protein [Methylobrevis albus]|uniref:Uncharacterized protein n=1 Tax=Methylobrevis albus TaxID=2793297 RepID=A0A931HYH7_9HYPH|nr:DUF6101 family protein [Methylobrevis albus]MBH0236957.1 hypothetical protein [Methylobrevis albus]
MTGAATAYAVRAQRLDPQALPARFTMPAGGSDAAVYLDRRGVVVKRRLSGLPLTLSLPISAFEGISVRIEPEGVDGLVAHVELTHRDPDLTLPLMVTRDMEEAALDWESWSSILGLPMLLTETDGQNRVVGGEAKVRIEAPKPRRRRAALQNRRPRFLARRKPGHSRPMPVIEGTEIIARN